MFGNCTISVCVTLQVNQCLQSTAFEKGAQGGFQRCWVTRELPLYITGKTRNSQETSATN